MMLNLGLVWDAAESERIMSQDETENIVGMYT